MDDERMDTDPLPARSVSDIDRFRLPNESDQQWFYRKQFIETFRYDYTEERLLCLAQCYANTKCLGCKYSEPLKSLLEELSEKIARSSMKRAISQGPDPTNQKRSVPMINQNTSINSMLTNAPNFVSFSSSGTPKTPTAATPPAKSTTIDPKSMLCDSAASKYVRLRTFANQLRQMVQSAQNRSGNDENDHAIEYIYQVGTQQHLFVDYRPENLPEAGHLHGKSSNAFLPQTFYGKLHIDDVYICAGNGSNKKSCKRHCFQQALNLFLSDDFEVNSAAVKDGRPQYELKQKMNQSQQQMEEDYESFGVPTSNPMEKSKINFVHARDTSTIATRIAKQQSQLEKQYWQRFGVNIAPLTGPRRVPRSFSPPPPVPHQTVDLSTPATIEGLPTTPASVASVIAAVEQAVYQQEHREGTQQTTSAMPTHMASSQMDVASYPQTEAISNNPAAVKKNIDPELVLQQKTKLTKLQPLLFNLLDTIADGNHAIDLISTLVNKYQLNVDFECGDKPTVNGFHGHLIIEQIEFADGFGINKKLAKKQTYSRALKAISPAKSFSLALHDGARWSLVCHPDNTGILPIPPSRRATTARSDDRPSRWGPPTAVSAVTSSSKSALRHLHERRAEEGAQREREYHTSSGICIPPPALIEPPLTRAEITKEVSKDISKCVSSTDETIIHNIRRLVPNTFVLFESLDFDENIPGHYVSLLFTSMSKNKLDLKFESTHAPNGFMVTYTIDDRFFMSWIAPTKVAAKQAGAKKAIEILRTIYPTIKTKHAVNDVSMNDHEIMGNKRKLITRSQLYEGPSSMLTNRTATAQTAPVQKEDLGMKLLKKMGWTGGGIGKDAQGITEPIQIEDLQGRKGLGSNNLFPNPTFMRNLRRILEEFIKTNTDDGELQFSSDFNSEERRAIHKEAMRLHLISNSYGREGERRIRITQKRDVDQLVDHLLTHGGETARYELKVQTQPRPLLTNPSRRHYAQTAPPPLLGGLAPDACDDGTL